MNPSAKPATGLDATLTGGRDTAFGASGGD